MNNWKIGTRITAGFGASILITVILGAFAYFEIHTINFYSTDNSANSLPSVELIGEIHASSQRIISRVFQHLVSTDRRQMADLDAEIKKVRAENAKRFERYPKQDLAKMQRAVRAQGPVIELGTNTGLPDALDHKFSSTMTGEDSGTK